MFPRRSGPKPKRPSRSGFSRPLDPGSAGIPAGSWVSFVGPALRRPLASLFSQAPWHRHSCLCSWGSLTVIPSHHPKPNSHSKRSKQPAFSSPAPANRNSLPITQEPICHSERSEEPAFSFLFRAPSPPHAALGFRPSETLDFQLSTLNFRLKLPIAFPYNPSYPPLVIP
jgi:hypothetical protein